ncbi:hypothetical protein [Hymenobacter cavernae]|uniref:Uncharacterized protein n=1 Tax=Hymenobacter cavernae TaxID=2044852 RepID=A0ABQ1UWA9_9BACT|nr:hypothetical protein [Hymenobacter cavernae]GGF27754.1 hypothetical protein GCM10011383_44320 [Hymenobacter cavernae]
MRPELERLQRIEHYLLSNPQPEQVADWRVQELLDADLASDTDFQRRAYQGIHAAGRKQLRRELAAIHQKLYRNQRQSLADYFRQALTNLGQQLRRFLVNLG